MRYCRRRVNNHGKQGEKEKCRLRIKSIRGEASDEGAARKLERRGWRIVFSDRETYGVRRSLNSRNAEYRDWPPRKISKTAAPTFMPKNSVGELAISTATPRRQ
jgi:hypothetical protein